MATKKKAPVVKELPTEEITESTIPVVVELPTEETIEEAPIEITDDVPTPVEEETPTEGQEEPTEEVNEVEEEVIVEDKKELHISKYNLESLEELYNTETDGYKRSSLLDIIDSYKEANGKLDMVMRLYI